MGPPPDSDEMIRMLENPMIASQMQEAMNNPAVIQMMQNSPMGRIQSRQSCATTYTNFAIVRNNPMIRQMLENPEMRRMLMDPAILRQSMAMNRMMRGGAGAGGNSGAVAPGVTDTTPQGAAGTTAAGENNTTGTNPQQQADPFGLGGMGGIFGQNMGGANPFSALFGQPPPAGGANTTDSAGQGQTPQANPFASLFGGGGAGGMPAFNPEMMQQMMQNFGMGGMGGGAPAAPQDTRPPEEMYAEQLRQLNEMGFYEFDRNVRALRMAGGNVQGAIEILFSGS